MIHLYSIVADLPIGSKVLQVSATDKDIGTISYHLEGTKYFGIGSESGILNMNMNDCLCNFTTK
jgi:hypothetical protein